MKFDNVLAEIDGFGKFQIGILLLLVIPRITLSFNFLLNNFIAAIPSHHCDISSLDDGGIFRNLSEQEKLVVSIPIQQDGSLSSCRMFAEPQYHLLFNSTNTTDLHTVPCQHGWKYDNTTFKTTLATESEMGALLSTGLCLFINIFIPEDLWLYFGNFENISPPNQSVIRTIVAVLGKSMSEASFTIIFLYTTELYPTVVRQNGLGYTSFLARLGVSISPLVTLLDDVWHLFPAVIYCAVAVGSGLVASLLPEALNTQLPELIEDIEKPRAKLTRKMETE
ncbi:solute carrier family 22 member 7-like [Kryptolebias marmoratus]|uniref:solute carrier family 22 member 7-like n=1 Tax=Kryptolebias marmoratus TaxID=37003 RepID=UPI000D52FFF1|nr:solute carrier family 22 member 7-like [Kryptolebias marmoratus]